MPSLVPPGGDPTTSGFTMPAQVTTLLIAIRKQGRGKVWVNPHWLQFPDHEQYRRFCKNSNIILGGEWNILSLPLTIISAVIALKRCYIFPRTVCLSLAPLRLSPEEQGTLVRSELSITMGIVTLVTTVCVAVSHQPTRRLAVWHGTWG